MYNVVRSTVSLDPGVGSSTARRKHIHILQNYMTAYHRNGGQQWGRMYII
jgi:hypothetical protein